MADRPFFPPRTLSTMAACRLSDADVLDVWVNREGQPARSGALTVRRDERRREEVGLLYTWRHNGDSVITAAWKRRRR